MSDQRPYDELGRLLSVIDEPGEDVPPAFAEALWSELRAGLRERPDIPVESGAETGVIEGSGVVDGADVADDGGIIERAHVIDLSAPDLSGPDLPRPTARTPWRRLTLAAAVVALLAFGVVVARDEIGPRITTEPDGTSTLGPAAPAGPGPQVPTDPVAACERYLGTQPTLTELAADDLERALESATAASNQLQSVDLPGIMPFRDVCAPVG